MLFGKKKSSEPQRRARQPVQGGRTGAQPVFSYHAQSARTEQAANNRRTTKLLWSSPGPAKPSPRRNPRTWPRRALIAGLAVLALLLLANSIFLSREPKIMITAGSDSRRLSLRSEDEYALAAREELARSFTNANKITINAGGLAEAMEARFPELDRVSVVLPFIGRQPVFYIQPARPALLLKGPDGAVFILDDSGRAIMNAAKVPQAGKLGLVVVEDQSGLPLDLGKSVLPSDDIAFITEVQGQLKAKNLKIVAMVLPPGTSELDVRIEGKPYMVKFNLRGDARAEVGSLLAVKQHLERENKTPGSYIDVRVDNRAYYR